MRKSIELYLESNLAISRSNLETMKEFYEDKYNSLLDKYRKEQNLNYDIKQNKAEQRRIGRQIRVLWFYLKEIGDSAK